jgi:hypothetical protein
VAQGARQVETSRPGSEHVRAAPVALAAAEPALLALQRAAGNSAVAALIQREHEAPGTAAGRRLDELLYPARVRNSLFSVPLEDRPAPGDQPGAGAQPSGPAGAGAEESRSLQAGEALRSVAEIPTVGHALATLRSRATEQVEHGGLRPSTGQRGAVVTSGATIAGPVLAGAVPDEKNREQALQQLDGRDVPVPSVDGLGVQFRALQEDLDVTFSLDVGRRPSTSPGSK